MSKAVIFDMDGILIDSEPVWKQTAKEIYGEVGIELTKEMMIETMGMRHDLVAAYWVRKFRRDDLSPEEISQKVEERMIDHVTNHVAFLPGAKEIFQRVHELEYKIAIASSSPMTMINAVVKRLGIEALLDTKHSAEFEQRGKPAPDVYITTAEKIGISPEYCIAIEDSPAGMRSAKDAGMKVIGIPDERFTSRASTAGLADVVLNSLEEIDKGLLDSLLPNSQ